MLTTALLLLALQASTVNVQATGSDTFNPANVNIKQGDTVAWSGLGDHNVHFADGTDSGFSNPTYSRTFTNPGTFTYVCDAHSGMRGSVTVTPTAGSAPGAPVPTFGPPSQGDLETAFPEAKIKIDFRKRRAFSFLILRTTSNTRVTVSKLPTGDLRFSIKNRTPDRKLKHVVFIW